MKLTFFTLAIAQLAGLGSCAPSVNANKFGNDAFSLQQVKNELFHGPSGPSALINAYAKYGKALPPALRKAMELNPELDLMFKNRMGQAGDTIASVPNYPAPYYDSQYVVPVQMGTPPQNIYLNLDTGSADLWTFSTDTDPSQVQGHTLYRPKDSKTSKLLANETWDVVYGDGASAKGIVYTDKVQLGGTSFSAQAVQSAVKVSAAITDDPFASGILGMGKSRVNTVRPTRQKTYIENIKDQLRHPLFTVDLQPQQPGTYDFGYIDKSKYKGGLKFVDVDQNSPYWEFTIDGYKMGKNSKELRPYRFQAIADTGTTLLLLPQNVVNDYYSKVKGADFDAYNGMMVFPCSSNPPDFVMALGKYRGVVPGHYMTYGRSNNTHCYGGIQSSEGIGFAIVGDVFLKAQFAVFDIGRSRIGFANKKTKPKA